MSARPISLESSWWTFDGTGDYLELPNVDADDFHPSMNSNDFSVVGVIKPAQTANVTPRAILGRAGSAPWINNDGEWALYQVGTELVLSTSRTAATQTSVGVFWLAAGVKTFIGAVYHYIAPLGMNSYTKLWIGANTNEVVTGMNGPIFKNNCPLRIGYTNNGSGNAYYDGDIYWLAYYNRKLTNAEMDGIRLGTTSPYDVPNLFMLINFCRGVAATYVTEEGLGPNAPYTFNVAGNPVQGGACAYPPTPGGAAISGIREGLNMLKPFLKTRTDEEDSEIIQEQIKKFTLQLEDNPLLDGHVLENIELAGGVPTIISHRLGRQMVGYIFVSTTSDIAAPLVYRTGDWDDKFFELTASLACTVSLYVFQKGKDFKYARIT